MEVTGGRSEVRNTRAAAGQRFLRDCPIHTRPQGHSGSTVTSNGSRCVCRVNCCTQGGAAAETFAAGPACLTHVTAHSCTSNLK